MRNWVTPKFTHLARIRAQYREPGLADRRRLERPSRRPPPRSSALDDAGPERCHVGRLEPRRAPARWRGYTGHRPRRLSSGNRERVGTRNPFIRRPFPVVFRPRAPGLRCSCRKWARWLWPGDDGAASREGFRRASRRSRPCEGVRGEHLLAQSFAASSVPRISLNHNTDFLIQLDLFFSLFRRLPFSHEVFLPAASTCRTSAATAPSTPSSSAALHPLDSIALPASAISTVPILSPRASLGPFNLLQLSVRPARYALRQPPCRWPVSPRIDRCAAKFGRPRGMAFCASVVESRSTAGGWPPRVGVTAPAIRQARSRVLGAAAPRRW